MFTTLYLRTLCKIVSLRSNLRYSKQDWGAATFYRELRTISMDFGRQTGKTSAGLQFMLIEPNSVMVTVNMAHARHLRKANPELAPRIYSCCEFVHHISRHPNDAKITSNKNRGLPFIEFKTDYIILDEPKFFIDKKYSGIAFSDFLYDRLDRMGVKWVFKLGMS